MSLFSDPATLPAGWQRDVAEMWPHMLAVYGTDEASPFAALLLDLAVRDHYQDQPMATIGGAPQLTEREDARISTTYTNRLGYEMDKGTREWRIQQRAFALTQAAHASILRAKRQR